MPKPRLIAIDIDGTLIDSKTRLLPSVEAAVRRAKDDGAMVTLATGRMISASRQYILKLDLHLPIIALNGSIVAGHRDGAKPLYHEPISPESSLQLIESAWDSGATLISVCCDTAFARNVDELTGPALDTWIVNMTDFADIATIDGKPPTAILIAGEQEAVNGIYTGTTALSLDDIDHYMFPSIRYFPMHYIEYRARGTSKGRALKMLREYLGIPRESVLAIGDYVNDLPMVDEAGIFACPASAHDDILAVADYVSPLSNEEGAVAQIIEELYFKAN
ncbi:MAG TPA: hypothetical protein ENN07_01430 [candidate division Zixibacteria bacterium]|nr:hypothetical protein [candidate division Zixibacteria bacterium]